MSREEIILIGKLADELMGIRAIEREGRVIVRLYYV